MIQNEIHLVPAHSPVQGLARVLLIDGDAASRITMRTVLEVGGYAVQIATTTVEAMELLDSLEFELVLCNPLSDPERIDAAILSYARFQSYEPATAVLTSIHCTGSGEEGLARHQVLVEPQNLPDLLSQVADLVGGRALSRLERQIPV
ncbi:MAG: hypothetical protein KIT83_12350 [Bryobacterales bacterium]|nr:hypothetical protein [Bryobacterales bacterium]